MQSNSAAGPATELADRFEHTFGTRPRIFSAPGRVNLIGEHTDYNDGWVMPCAIGFATRVAIAPRSDSRLVLCSEEFPERFEWHVDNLPSHKMGAWYDYVLGVAVALHQTGSTLRGANLLAHGEVPIGAGLSSSASLEVATALALINLNGIALPLSRVAKLCRQAENTFVGAHVGIMDQFVSCLGRAGQAMVLDCRSLEFRFVPVPSHIRIVLCNTMVKHKLAGSQYNLRREECSEGVKMLKQWYPRILALRDVSVEQLEEHFADIPEVIYKRCLHVVRENRRVADAAEALVAGNLARLGQLMRESHHNLQSLYEVSCPELDLMVEVAEGLPGYWGGRMTGGGFGGCTVNLVEADAAEAFARQVSERYEAAMGIHPETYICSASDGAHAESNLPH